MTKLTLDQVRHIASLARLKITEDEVNRFAEELTSILAYIDTLREVDTTQVSQTTQVTGLKNPFREDILCLENHPTSDALLSCSPLPIIEHQIQTPSALG